MSKNLLLAIFWFTLAQVAIWFQINGQFLWPWFRRNEIIVACLGAVISYFYIWGTKYGVLAFDGLLWPNRFIGFSIGIFIYAFLLNIFFDEGISLKTGVSLALCTALILIQVLWK